MDSKESFYYSPINFVRYLFNLINTVTRTQIKVQNIFCEYNPNLI